jgi:glycosyltransferase involved in cell wall biosynthesis
MRAEPQPVRVLWLVKGLGAGGAEHLLALMATARDRAAFRYQVAYLLPWKDALVPDFEREGVPVSCLHGGREWDLRWTLRLRSMLMSERFDILHVHSPYVAGLARLLGRTIAAHHRPKIVTTEHLPWSGYALPTRLLNAATMGLDDVTFAVSGSVLDSIPQVLRRKVILEPNGIDLGRVRRWGASRETERQALGLRHDDLLVCTVANLRAQKDYPTLMRAAARVVREHPRIHFVAIGDGPLEAELVALHRDLRLGDRFRFLGRLTEPARVLAASDMFVLTSRYEGLPLSLLEALALGLPAVVTSVPGILDAIEGDHQAVLVPAAEPMAVAQGLLDLAADPERRANLSAAAVQRANAFDVVRMTSRIEEGYRRLFEERRTPRLVPGREEA